MGVSALASVDVSAASVLVFSALFPQVNYGLRGFPERRVQAVVGFDDRVQFDASFGPHDQAPPEPGPESEYSRPGVESQLFEIG